MSVRKLERPPRLLPLFARSAVSMLPGASLLPLVPGGGSSVPEIELALEHVAVDAERVAAYAKVCGFPLRAQLPITYPHVLAFPLHMALMADGAFPFGAVGLVHVENRIVQRAPIPIGQELSLRVKAGALSPHRRGRTFTLHTEVSADGEVVWEDFSTMLRRGGSGETRITGDGGEADDLARGADAAELPTVATWRLPGDLGRRYAAVSGDSNPIHLHPLSAKLFGFPGAIAHGMWSKARCLAALESRTPSACEVRVSFRKPIVLPARVEFASTPPERDLGAHARQGAGAPAQRGAGAHEDAVIRFALRAAERRTSHLDGAIASLKSKSVTPGPARARSSKQGA